MRIVKLFIPVLFLTVIYSSGQAAVLLGNNAGGSANAGSTVLRSVAYTAGNTGTAEGIVIYCSNVTAGDKVRAGIYINDSGVNTYLPNALLVQCPEFSVETGWNYLTITPKIICAGQSYCLAFQFSNPNTNYLYGTDSGRIRHYKTYTYGSLPDPHGNTTGSGYDQYFSIYATGPLGTYTETPTYTITPTHSPTRTASPTRTITPTVSPTSTPTPIRCLKNRWNKTTWKWWE